MCAQFTDDDLEKSVEDANGEIIGSVTAVEGDVARVQPKAGVMDSIRAAIGWTRTQESVSIRADSVDEVTDEVIRLETESLEADGAAGSVDEPETADSGSVEARHGSRLESDEAGIERSETDRLEGAERQESTAGATDSAETAALEDELNRGPKVEPPAESEVRDVLDETVETESGGTAETGNATGDSEAEAERRDAPEAGPAAEGSELAERSDPAEEPDSRDRPAAAEATDGIDESYGETSETDEDTGGAEIEDPDPDGEASESAEDSERETDETNLAEELNRGPDLESVGGGDDTRERSAEADADAELARGSDLESAVEPTEEAPERIETEEMDLADELDRGTDLDAAEEGTSSKAPDRGEEAQPTAEMDLAEELNRGPDLESAVEAGHEEDAPVDTDASPSPGPGPGSQTDAGSTTEATAPRSTEPASHAALEAEPALDHRTDEPATDDADTAETDRRHPERGDVGSPIGAMIDAQRTAIARSQQLLEDSLAVQRDVNEIALSTLRGQLALQRQGFELFRASTPDLVEAADMMVPSTAVADRDREFERRLELVDGLDSMYRERLEDAGITTLDDLADADAETVADAAEVTEKRAERWIDQAAA